ncbi:MAG TPA: TetR/AcrR family transcriptional regulator [Syntrophorhabdales bacterium]|nr:TetR/AcrR family transcriptional regulator [Syntrophorhabdales bacterium]
MAARKSVLLNEQSTTTTVGQSVRRRIITNARRRFLAHGFRIITMDDLATDLGMSKKTLYAHFPNKVALLEAVLRDKMHDIDVDLGRIASGDISSFPALLQELSACLRQHLEEIQPSFLWDIQREQPDMFLLVQKRRLEMIHRYFGKVLEEGRKAGLICKDLPPAFIIELLLAAVESILTPQKMKEMELTPPDGFLAIIRVVLTGIMTEKGRARMSKWGEPRMSSRKTRLREG